MTTLLLLIIMMTFISLGLPDAMLGAAWPSMYPQFDVPVSYAGAVSMIIALGTIISSLQSDRLTRRFGTGRITAASVAMTAVALWGFSTCRHFWMLCIWAVPYGLGAGSVDASINNYVALHYESRHMSWLHCMWGVGAAIGPVIMGHVLTSGLSWDRGYLTVSLMQLVLTVGILLSLPLWKGRTGSQKPGEGDPDDKPLTLLQVASIRGAKHVFIMFLCYCALEQTAMLWGSSYLSLARGVSPERAARFASMFCIGITLGRFLSGFLTVRFNDVQMIRMGQGVVLGALVLMLIPVQSSWLAILGLSLVGIGCAPIYPCVIHSTPAHFGADNSQAIIGMQMAFAYLGTLLMPPLFGLIAGHISVGLLPVYLLVLLFLMFFMHEGLLRQLEASHGDARS